MVLGEYSDALPRLCWEGIECLCVGGDSCGIFARHHIGITTRLAQLVTLCHCGVDISTELLAYPTAFAP